MKWIKAGIFALVLVLLVGSVFVFKLYSKQTNVVQNGGILEVKSPQEKPHLKKTI